eukprot:Platyproteum_vivax@DN7772_c0_g1_i1.p1
MLSLYKNQVVTSVVKAQIEIRQLELDWYSENYWTLSTHAAVIGGFAFSQLSTATPEETHWLLEVSFLLVSAFAFGFCLVVVTSCTFCCMWSQGLALRGPHGTRSVHLAVDNLRAQQPSVFAYFLLGMVSFFISELLLLFVFYDHHVAYIVVIPISVFLFVMLWYIVHLTSSLRVVDSDAVEGRIDLLKEYENVPDLDREFHHKQQP